MTCILLEFDRPSSANRERYYFCRQERLDTADRDQSRGRGVDLKAFKGLGGRI